MKEQNNAIKITAIIAGVVLIIALVAITSLNPSQNTVNVDGMATVKAMPDVIGVYFNIQTKGDTSVEAKDANSEISETLTNKLILLGFDKEDIVTENYNIYPEYEWINNQRKEDGFVATHSIKLEISSEESNKLGSIIDAGVDSGAGINYISFELSQELQNQYKAEAMKLAAEDARIKAEAVAEGFNKKLGKLVSTSVNDFGYYPWMLYESAGTMDASGAKEATTNIQPGEKEITARISAVFKIY